MKALLHSKLYIIIFIAFLSFSCSKNSDNPVSPSTAQFNAGFLDSIYSTASQIPNLRSFVISDYKGVIREQYFHNLTAGTAHDVRSVTKTVVCLLIGIAIDKGIIPSIDQPISDYFKAPEYVLTQQKQSITIRNLVTMSSGFSWEELISVSGYSNWFNSSNQVNYVLSRDMAANPGETFVYNSGALHLLSAIITKASRMSTFEFAKQYLFLPLGIGDRFWQTEKQGLYNGSAGLKITPQDMVELGKLFLNRGKAGDVQVVSSNWIDEMTGFKITTNNAVPIGTGYGYGLWIGTSAKGPIAFANGWGGQFIVVVPSVNLVISATNDWSNISTTTANEQWYRTISLIVDGVIAGIK